jgi:hypothetical protein
MNQLKELPDLARSFTLMKINDKLRTVSDCTLLGVAICHRLMTKGLDKQLLQTILDAYVDNQEATKDVVGEDAILLIAEILHK